MLLWTRIMRRKFDPRLVRNIQSHCHDEFEKSLILSENFDLETLDRTPLTFVFDK